MRIAVFDTHPYDERALNEANANGEHELEFFEERLHSKTADLAQGFDAVCPFVNCRLGERVLTKLASFGVKLVTLRAAGYNGIDIATAERLGIKVTRVPAYSPEAVAEHNFALLLTLIRKTHRAFNRVREQNFSLDGLEGFNLHGKTYAALGAGRIGQCALRIAKAVSYTHLTLPTICSG